jgi:hypothetical protein
VVQDHRICATLGIQRPLHETPARVFPGLGTRRRASATCGGAWQILSKFSLEQMRLILAVEADLKPNAASGVRNWLERGWVDMAMIQRNTDSVHNLGEGTSRLSFDLHNEWGIERHIALLSRP